MSGSVLKVLLWKHFTVRIRRYIHSLVEFASPVVFFVILFSFKAVIIPTGSMPSMDNMTRVEGTDSYSLSGVKPPSRIFYHPDTNLAGLLIDDVGQKFRMKRLPSLVGPYQFANGYYGISNESELETAYLAPSDAVVLFHNLDDTEWPESLNYTIRMKERFVTHLTEAMDGLHPHEGFGTIYEGFMKVQWAVDTSYIYLRTGHKIEQNITLQEFPFYRRMEHQTVKIICQILSVMCYLSLILVFVFLVCRLLEERSTGIQELTKMVGVSSNMLGISHFMNVLPGGWLYAIVGATLVKVTSNPFIPNTNWLYIFLILILHFVSIVSMAFACSYLAKGTQYSITIALFSYAALGAPTTMLPKEMPRLLVFLSGLLPHQPMIWFWTEVGANEEYGDGLSLSSLVSAHTPYSGCVLLSYFMLLVQSAICFCLTWYLNLVRPGKYGQALPWGFLFQRQYWSKNEVIPDDLSEVELINNGSSMSTEDIKYFEKPSRNLEVGIKISNVTKVFPKHKALDDVTLDVYKDEITVLLGHNGAGKTTLMSIITGMVGATRGSVYVNGRNNVTERDEVRRHLGLCPQHNLFFSDLTVLEHVMFFTLLKGTTFQEARKSSQSLLKQLGLSGKEGGRSAELSGGMKRRLQLACALAGDADVLVLDEPTSGLDVETRRGLWDLLLGLRGSRTVLVSTHFMEEAEALGDRVAALHCGRLCCHASPMHLKRALGTGYRLSLTTDGAPQESKITKVVATHVPTAEVKDQSINSLTYSLPAADSKKFHSLFTALEDRRLELSINSIGVGISTLEEVFLKLCSDTNTIWGNEDKNGTTEEIEASQYPKYTGMRLITRQMWILLLRQMRFVISRKWSFITLQLLVPIALIWGITYVFNNEMGDPVSNPKIALDLDLYKNKLERRVLYNATDISALQRMYPKVVFEPTSDVVEAILRYAKKDIWEYNKYLIGLEVNDTDAKVLFTTVVRHAAPTALSALANLLAARELPGAPALTTSVWPLQGSWQVHQDYKEPKIRELLFFWVLCTIFIILATNINAVSLPCRERVFGARRALALCGCGAALHWASTLLFHALVCVLGLLLPLLIIAAAVDADGTIDQPDFLMSFLLLMLLGCLSFFAFMYLVSFWFEERGAGAFLAGYTIVFGFVTSLIQITSELLSDSPSSLTSIVMHACWLLAPPHTLVLGAARAAHVARLNAFCTLNRDRCPAIMFDTGFDAKACCAGQNPRCYMCIDDYSPGQEMIVLACQFVVFMSLVLACECGWAGAAWERVVNARYSAPVTDVAHADQPAADAHVRTAQLYVDKEIDLPDNKQTDAMLVHNVHKNYFRVFGKSCNAVKGVSFVVKKGECFGLLGVNGAGKSTIFKMLTAEEVPTRGRIFANGFHLDRNRKEYLRTLGYCPQFHGLDDFLTGQQNLELLLTMRGLNAYDAQKETNAWLHTLGLEKLQHRALRAYSGGSARRLCAGAALAAGGALALLDEPTAGVDVAARRRLWAGVTRALRTGRSVLLSSHSMDETEALCDQIAIVAAGRVRALGSAPELRARHAAGHAVLLQLRRDHEQEGQHDEVDSTKSRVNNLKAALHEAFVGTIKDEHKTTIRYHISDPMRYSDLFDKLEQLKQQYQDLLEDYSVTETTLEEVFLSFAKESYN